MVRLLDGVVAGRDQGEQVSFTSIVLTHTFLNPDGSGASGNAVFVLSGRMTNGTTSYMASAPITSAFSSAGALSQALPANDDIATTPTGQTWLVTINVAGARPEQYEIVVPHAAVAGTADLGTLLPETRQVG